MPRTVFTPADAYLLLLCNMLAHFCFSFIKFTLHHITIAMGAGKGYTMNKLVEKGRFPLLAFVPVDPDEIRRHFPEFQIYVDQNPELAGGTSGFVAMFLELHVHVFVTGLHRYCCFVFVVVVYQSLLERRRGLLQRF